MESPYSPGAGVMPPLFAGRDVERARALEQLVRTEQFRAPGRSPLILTGVRGVGKTVTLRSIANEASHRRFVTAHATAVRRGTLAPQIAAAVAEQVAQADGSRSGHRWQRWRERLAKMSIEVSVAGIVKIGRVAPDHDLRSVDDDLLVGVLGDSAQLVLDLGHPGLCLTVDELQEGSESDLAQLTTAAQQLTDAPLVIIGAGLPQTPDRLMAAGSFAERFQYQLLQPLTAAEAATALLIPAQAAGVLWEQPAADLVLSQAQGSPYLVQMYGDAAWRNAQPQPGGRIAFVHAQSGLLQAHTELHNGLFRGRWNRASPAEREFLTAMAANLAADGTVESAVVATTLSRSQSQISYLRSRLLDKGLVTSPTRGRLAFTLAGFDRFVTEQS